MRILFFFLNLVSKNHLFGVYVSDFSVSFQPIAAFQLALLSHLTASPTLTATGNFHLPSPCLKTRSSCASGWTTLIMIFLLLNTVYFAMLLMDDGCVCFFKLRIYCNFKKIPCL